MITELIGKPTKRYYHTATSIGDQIYVFGGKNFSCRVNELYVYSFTDDTCTLIKGIGNPPGPRSSHTAVAYNSSIFIFGGMFKDENSASNYIELYNDLYEFETSL